MAYLDKLLSADERILVQQRPHWAVFVSTAVGLVIQGLFFLLLYKAFHALSEPADPSTWMQRLPPEIRGELRQVALQMPELFDKLTVGIVLLFAFLAFTTVLKTVLAWLTSHTVITNRRVVQVHGLISKTVVDSSLEKINDVLLQQPLLGRLFGYGTIVVMTASETGLNRMVFLKNPVEFKRIMMEAKRRLSGDGGPRAPEPANTPKQQAADRLAELGDLRKSGLISAAEYDAKRRAVLDEI
ncbi:MAG: PH domain-containing protein [bacterium]